MTGWFSRFEEELLEHYFGFQIWLSLYEHPGQKPFWYIAVEFDNIHREKQPRSIRYLNGWVKERIAERKINWTRTELGRRYRKKKLKEYLELHISSSHLRDYLVEFI